MRERVRPSKVSVAASAISGARPARYGERSEALAAVLEQTNIVTTDWRRHGQLRVRQFERERVFLADRRVGPAERAIELQHPQRAVLVTQLIDAVLVAVERKQPSRRLQSDAFGSRGHLPRCQSLERSECRLRHSHTGTLM